MPQFYKYYIVFGLICGGQAMALALTQDFDLSSTAAKCYAEKSGAVQVKFNEGIAPYIFVLSLDSLRKSEIKRSPILKVGDFSFKEIAAGKYFVTAICGDGKVYSQKTAIDQPPQLRPGKISVESYPASVSAMDGVILANPTGGTIPYIFSWQGIGAKGSDKKISGLGPGIYKCTITDSHGCGPVSATIVLKANVSSKATSYFNYSSSDNICLIEEAVHFSFN